MSNEQSEPQLWIDAWDARRLKLRDEFISAGMDAEAADEQATQQVRREIRRSPPLSLPES